VSGKVLYDGSDGHNPCYDVTDNEIDTLAIVSGRRHLTEALSSQVSTPTLHNPSLRQLGGLVVGKGWELISVKPGVCDGGYYSICGRAANDECPALAHHDSRGTIVGTEYSGWIIMDVPSIKHGIIMLRFLTWLTVEESPRTKDWHSVNNERRSLRNNLNSTQSSSFAFDLLESYDEDKPFEERRRLKTAADFPDDFKFEYSINGIVTTLSKQEFLERRREPQRVFELITLMDDPSFTGSSIEVAIRLRDCGHDCVIGLTHLYWA
jgi:hypothetical protein